MVASVITGDAASGSGCGSGEVEGFFQTGSAQRLSPLVSPRTPRTNLINGHTAPLPLRPHTAHCHHPRIPQDAVQCLAVARPRSGITTLIRVRPNPTTEVSSGDPTTWPVFLCAGPRVSRRWARGERLQVLLAHDPRWQQRPVEEVGDALRCLIVHDILHKYSIEFSRATRGLESCARGSRAWLNANQGATMRWCNKQSPTCNTMEN